VAVLAVEHKLIIHLSIVVAMDEFVKWNSLSNYCVFYVWNILLKANKFREYRRGNQKWTIQRNWQHRVHKTKKNKANIQHNQYVVDTTMCKQTQTT
jgi:hypothetical protein